MRSCGPSVLYRKMSLAVCVLVFSHQCPRPTCFYFLSPFNIPVWRLCLLLLKPPSCMCTWKHNRERSPLSFGEGERETKKTKTITKRKTTHRHISTLWDHPHASVEIVSLLLMITDDDYDDNDDDRRSRCSSQHLPLLGQHRITRESWLESGDVWLFYLPPTLTQFSSLTVALVLPFSVVLLGK